MRLTPELFEQITGCKESSLEQVGPKKTEDPSLTSRLPLAFRAIACPLEGDHYEAPVPVHVCDISVLGIGLTHNADVGLGKRFVICLRKQGEPGQPAQMLPLRCETVNLQTIGKTQIRLGARFDAVADAEPLLRAISQNPAPAANPAHAAQPAHPSHSAHPPHAANAAHTAAALPPSVALGGATAPVGPPPREPDEVQRIRDALLS